MQNIYAKNFKNILLDEDASLYKRYKSHTSDDISHIIKTKALVYTMYIYTLHTYIHTHTFIVVTCT